MAHLSTIVGPKVKTIARGANETVVKPLVVSGYTWNMGGVDLADQKRSYYECKIQTGKWPTHLFLWMIDAAMVNSHIWYAETYPNKPKMSGREWRLRVIYGLFRLDSARMSSISKVLLVQAASAPPPPPSQSLSANPALKNRWGDHVPTRRLAKTALACEWCKMQANAMKASGRATIRPRESRYVCSHCQRDKDTASNGLKCTNISLCTSLCRSSTEVGATCFYLYHRHHFGSTPTFPAGDASAAAAASFSAAAAASAELGATPNRLGDAMDEAL